MPSITSVMTALGMMPVPLIGWPTRRSVVVEFVTTLEPRVRLPVTAVAATEERLLSKRSA